MCPRLKSSPPNSRIMEPRTCEASSQFHTEATGFWDVSVMLGSCTYGHPNALPLGGCPSVSNPRSILSSSWLWMSCREPLYPPSACLCRIYIKFQIEVDLHPAAANPQRHLSRQEKQSFSQNVIIFNIQR